MNPELQNPYFPSARRWGIGFGLCMLVSVGGASLGLLPPPASIVIGTLGGTSCLIFWLSLWLTGRSLEGELEAFRQGNVIEQWPLSTEDYRRWWEQRRQAVTHAGLLVGAMVVLMGAVVGSLLWIDEHKPELGATVLGGSVLVGAAVALVMRWVLSGPGPREQERYTVWIGPDLAILNGQVYRWQGPGLRLDRAEALENPPRLRVNFRAAIKGGWAEQRVEFPAPSMTAAEAVARRLEAGRRD